MDPLTILSGVSTAYSLGKQLFGKQKSFADTELGRKLKELSQKGIDTQPIIGEISGNLANVSQQGKTALKGRLISQGMGGSIAGQRAISEIDTKRMDKLQKAIKDIQMKNEQLKTQYALQYAQAGTEYDTAQQQQESAALSDLLGVSGSILYDQLSPQPDYAQLFQAMNKEPEKKLETFRPNFRNRMPSINFNPYRPEVPLQAPNPYVYPERLP